MPARYVSGTNPYALDRLIGASARAALIVMAAVFVACLAGIHSRPVGFLANIWPANAIMLGLLLRMPAAATPLGWGAGAAAFLAADLLTGSTPIKAVLLNSANLLSIGIAYTIYERLPADRVQLREPVSMLTLVVVAATGSLGSAAVGGLLNPILFNGSILSGWSLWYSTELVNYIAILPVLLSAPRLSTIRSRVSKAAASISWAGVLPVIALVISCLASVVIGGPGAMAFPVPALLWCGLTYPVFPTSILTLIWGFWTVMVIGELGAEPGVVDEMALASIRLGVSLLALVPIVLSSVMQSRNELLVELQRIAMQDQLTGTRTRGAFFAEAHQVLGRSSKPLAMLMLDLDNFKIINDTHGHAAGDQVLSAFAKRVSQLLRPGDLFGRLGGEQFAVLVPDCAIDDAARIAERILTAVGSNPVRLRDGRIVPVTSSIGVSAKMPSDTQNLDDLLAEADAALYLAKRNGRNRCEIARPARPVSPVSPVPPLASTLPRAV